MKGENEKDIHQELHRGSYIYSITFVCQNHLFVNNHSETQRASCNVKPNKHQTAVSSAVENCSVRAC